MKECTHPSLVMLCRITETSHQPSQPQAADESHHSDADLSDAVPTGTTSGPPVAHHEQ